MVTIVALTHAICVKCRARYLMCPLYLCGTQDFHGYVSESSLKAFIKFGKIKCIFHISNKGHADTSI